jgi:hypothetical protein
MLAVQINQNVPTDSDMAKKLTTDDSVAPQKYVSSDGIQCSW